MTKGSNVIVVAAIVAAGCGGGGGAATVGGACSTYAANYCARFESCAPGLNWIFGFTNMADCVAASRQSCETASAGAHSGLTPSVISACASATAGEDCDAVLGTGPAACQPHGGTLALGAACLNDWQCSTGRCTGNGLMCGVCAVAVPEGASCDPNDDQCANGLVCASSPVDPSQAVCQKFAKVGDACGACPIGSYCAPDTQRCTVAPGLGESCDPSASFFCDPEIAAVCDGTTSTCVAAPTVVQPGASCDGNTRCAGSCITQVDGTQLCQPYVDAGQSCDPMQRICRVGLACDQGVCDACGTGGATAFQGTGPLRPALLARVPAQWRAALLGGLR